jgi:hypothetical protein
MWITQALLLPTTFVGKALREGVRFKQTNNKKREERTKEESPHA